MSEINCDCDNPSFGHVGRPKCVLIRGVLAIPIFRARYRANGTRNFLPTNAAGITLYNAEYGTSHTTIAQVMDSLVNHADPLDAIYPGLKVENASFARTETTFETAPSGRRVKLAGGGVRTWSMELWDKDSAHGVLRAYNQFGCEDLDVYHVPVDGNLWGVMDNSTSGMMRGYEMDTASFDAFMDYATDTASQKLMMSWDLDSLECEENSYAITVAEYGKKFTTLKPLIQGYSSATNPSTTEIAIKVWTGFGTAGNKGDIVGLKTASFVVKDAALTVFTHSAATTSVVDADGFLTYTITMDAAMASGNWTTATTAPGYDVPVAKFTV